MSEKQLGGDRWNTFAEHGSLTAREFFAGTEPLLHGTLDALREVDRAVLADQIRATLALGTRETALPLNGTPEAPRVTRELAGQARVIGEELAGWAVAALDRRTAFPAGPLVVRSRCDGHLLTHEAADLLLGVRGGAVPMQMYNEWLHQIVLLRDALLPFTNWREVPLSVTPRGLRHLEEARERFLAEALIRQVRHESLVRYARQVITGGNDPAVPGEYGFDHPGGTVLPAVVGSSPVDAPRYLLTWRAGAADAKATAYVPAIEDYYAEPRSPLPGARVVAGPLPEGRIVAGPVTGGHRTAHIEVTRDDVTLSTDLGQALRGHRFARRGGPGDGRGGPRDGVLVDPWAVLGADGLVSADGVRVDPAGLGDVATLALLGKLYPDGVTVG